MAAKGLIYFAEEELQITVRNVSLSGLFAEIDVRETIKDVEDLLHGFSQSPLIDIVLEEMNLAGEAEVVRAEHAEGKIMIGLEFRNITYGIKDHLYKRKYYRKGLTGPGNIVLNGKNYHFTSYNVSVAGLMIYLPKRIPVKRGSVTKFEFPMLGLKGQVKVMWTNYDAKGGTLLGLQYVYMERSNFKGIPRFLRNKYN